MNVLYEVPVFGKFTDALANAGVQTNSARGFWGGVTNEGEIVVTSWFHRKDSKGRFCIWKPKTNHGNLKYQWENGNIRVGTEVSMILLRPRGHEDSRKIGGAALMPGKWRVVELSESGDWDALIEPAPVLKK